jgi:hypothetical protein
LIDRWGLDCFSLMQRSTVGYTGNVGLQRYISCLCNPLES